MSGGDLEFVKTAVAVINLFGTIGVALWAWLRGPSEANTKRLESLDGEVQGMGKKLLGIEGRLQFIPTDTDLSELRGDLKAMKATHEAFQREMHGMNAALQRIEEFLLKAPR